VRVLMVCAVLLSPVIAHAQQHRPLDTPDPVQSSQAPARMRLILKDGSYQLVLSYKVVGDVVRFRSAERDGEEEEIPLALVDLAATERWKKDHEPGAQAAQSAC
jgi:threonine dehydratase